MDGLQFAGQITGFDDAVKGTKGTIHISIQQRNARKSITKVQGINPAVDLEKVLKALKKVIFSYSYKYFEHSRHTYPRPTAATVLLLLTLLMEATSFSFKATSVSKCKSS